LRILPPLDVGVPLGYQRHRSGDQFGARLSSLGGFDPLDSAVAAHKHTRTVPIVIANGSGPLQAGIAKSYAQPGGNVTGVVNQGEELTSKQLQLLKTISPRDGERRCFGEWIGNYPRGNLARGDTSRVGIVPQIA